MREAAQHALSLAEVSEQTSIEPNHIRFIESAFRETFEAKGHSLGARFYSPGRVELLCRIHQLMFGERLAAADVRAHLQQEERGQGARHKLITVTSGKGGVGKTTVAVNLAVAMAGQGKRVLLFDGDLGLANAHVMAGVNPKGTLVDLLEGRAGMEEVVMEGPAGLHLVCGGSGVMHLANLEQRLREFLGRELDRLGRTYDVVMVDTGAGISDQVLHFLRLADEIVLVTTPNLAATLDAYGMVKVAYRTGLRGRMRILVNQARDEVQAEATYEKLRSCSKKFLEREPDYIGFTFSDAGVERSCQTRLPLVLLDPGSPFSQTMQRLVGPLTETQAIPLPAETLQATPV